MLNQLLETKQVTRRKTGGTLVSVALHVLLIGAAVHLTQRSLVAAVPPEQVNVRPIPIEPKPDTPVERRSDQAVATSRSPLGSPVLIAPVDVPLDIPPIDLSATRTNPDDFTGKPVPGGRPDGDSTLTSPIAGDQPMFSFEVDKPAAALPGSASPAYPDMLKASGVEGNAVVQFVVDTLGRAEAGSFKLLQSSHDAFGTAVRVTLPRMRFLPAEAGGRKVRMLVQQQFAFALNR
jgi:periplasmic protein TonB